MDTIVIAVISVASIGLLCAVILAVASKMMASGVDEQVARLRACMPGANCGACGFAGCESYAVALSDGGTAANLCIPGGNELVKQISDILGIESGEGIARRVAVVHCMGDHDTKRAKMEYFGIHTCVAENLLFGGKSACTFGCNGFGDCAAVCPSSAICVEKGLARIDTRKCSGCELCMKICPNNVIAIEDGSITFIVKCRNTEKGAIMKDKCLIGCIGCGRCVKVCPTQAIAVTDFLATIDYDKCTGCGKCVDVCVKGCIVPTTA